MTQWFDTHVHLERYSPDDQRRLVDEATAMDVGGMLAVSTSRGSSRRTVVLSESVLKAVGVHPTRATGAEPAELRELARQPGVVAVGETGFDDSGPGFAIQLASFADQASIACDLNLALILHIEGPNAWLALLDAESQLVGARVIRHYFTGDEAQANWHAERGHYLSFGRPLVREPRLQELAATYPPDLLLIETDSYPLPGRATEPSSLPEVGEALAHALRWSLMACAAQLWLNSHRALGIGLPAN
ncbi:MAG: TatD family hydrolase [Tepidiformaceae bacterium]